MDETIRNEFPEKNTDVKQFANISIVTITNKDGDVNEVISWYEDQQPKDSYLGEHVKEKREVDIAIKDIGLSIIGPSIKDATGKLKEYFGIYETR